MNLMIKIKKEDSIIYISGNEDDVKLIKNFLMKEENKWGLPRKIVKALKPGNELSKLTDLVKYKRIYKKPGFKFECIIKGGDGNKICGSSNKINSIRRESEKY